ncbi:MAG: methylmalonyl-CoA epimerase [Hyphomonadaceae bacterium]
MPSIEAAKATYRDLYGVPERAITETREPPAQGVKFAFVNVANSQIELIEPLPGVDSPIAKFIEKNPRRTTPRLLRSGRYLRARDEMIVRGARVPNEPRIGAHGTPIISQTPRTPTAC